MKLLLVENEPLDQVAFKRFVKREYPTYEYVISSSVADGKYQLEQSAFDVVLVDYLLNDGTGFDVLPLVDPTVPVVFITGSGSEEVAIEALRKGASDYLIKDVERTYLKLLPIVIERAIKSKRESNRWQLLSQAVKSSSDSIIITALDGTITFVNDAFNKTYHYTEAEIIGQHWTILAPAGDEWHSMGEGQNIECVHLRNGGVAFPVSMSRSAVRDEHGHQFAYLVTTRDVTKRKQIEEELRKSEAYLRSIINAQNTLVIRMDLEGNYTFINDVMYEMFGWMYNENEPMIGKSSMITIIPEDHPKTIATVEKCINNPEESFQVALRKPTPDGDVLWFLWEFAAMLDAKGQVSEIQCVGIDISAHKLAEQQAFELKLEKNRLQMVSSFINDAAHEFRTPLSIISSNAYLMTKQNDIEQRKAKAQSTEEQIQRIITLVDSMTLIAQIESWKGTDRRQISINHLLTNASKNIFAAYQQDHQITFDLNDDIPDILGHPEYLQKAFEQIIHNAQRYTPIHGEIAIKTTQNQEHIWVQIQDSGIGISLEYINHIFDIFWRNDESHTTAGLGLGLPIAKRIIAAHNGEITVSSRIGDGSCFTIKLPAW